MLPLFWLMSLFPVTGDWTQGLTNARHMCCNCPDKTAEKATCAVQLVETMDPKKNENFLQDLMLEKEKISSPGVIQKECMS